MTSLRTQLEELDAAGRADDFKALTASGFIYAIAKVFHEHHHGPLDHAQAIAEAVGALEMIETTECPFGHPDFDWSEDAAHDVAMEAKQDWEKVDV